MKSLEQLAQSAYEAFAKEAEKGGQAVYLAMDLPAWPHLPAARRACWLAATKQLWAEFAAVH